MDILKTTCNEQDNSHIPPSQQNIDLFKKDISNLNVNFLYGVVTVKVGRILTGNPIRKHNINYTKDFHSL